MMKYRRGNLFLTVVVFLLLTMSIGGLFTLTVSNKTDSYEKAKQAGNINSYIALANVCADAFRNDLESQTVRINTADVNNPAGAVGGDGGEGVQPAQIPVTIYEDAIKIIQKGDASRQGLQLAAVAGEPDAWWYTLVNASDALAYAGVSDSDTLSATEKLLKDSKLTIKVLAPLTLSLSGEEDGTTMETGDTMTVDNIYYQVILTKGTTKITQDYCLEGEKLTGRFESSLVWIAVDGESATNNLTGQIATQRNVIG